MFSIINHWRNGIQITKYHFIITMIAITKSMGTNNCCRGEEIWTLVHCWWECKIVQLLWNRVWQFLDKSNIEWLYGSATPLLSIFPREWEHVHTKSCTWMFTAELLIISKIQIKSVNKLIKMAYPHNGILFIHNFDTWYNMGQIWKQCKKWKKSDTEDHLFYTSIYMQCPNWQI